MAFPGGKLSVGCIQGMYQGQTPSSPIVQILDIKRIQGTTASGTQPERYRLVISDSVHYQQAMLATQLNYLIQNNAIASRCVVKLNEYICNTVHNRRIVIILGLETVSAPLPANIGNPNNIEQTNASAAPSTTSTTPFNAPPPSTNTSLPPPPSAAAPSYSKPPPAKRTLPPQYGNSTNAPQQMDASWSSSVHPIKSLNPYSPRFTIKARVTSKSEMREWNNAKGNGRLFHVDLVDTTGEIRATMFNEAADKFYELLQVGKVYLISKGHVKMANKKFSSIKNEYELSLDSNTVIQETQEGDSSIPNMLYSFTPIREILEVQKDEVIDVLGIVYQTGEVKNISTKTGKDLAKRNVTIFDATAAGIEFTLWGEKAEHIAWHESEHPVIALKCVKVSDFNEKTLTAVSSTHIEVNPDIREAKELRAWYDNTGGNVQIYFLSKGSSMSGGGGEGGFKAAKSSTQRKTIAEVKEAVVSGEKASFFETKASIMIIKSDKDMWYLACPGENCSKKVTSNGAGEFTCDKCMTNYPSCKVRYILSFNAGDHTGSCWFNTFNEPASQLLGAEADVLMNMKQNNKPQFDAMIYDAAFKQYKLKIRAKEEFYNNEAKIRYSVMQATPIDFTQESTNLINLIRQYA